MQHLAPDRLNLLRVDDCPNMLKYLQDALELQQRVDLGRVQVDDLLDHR